MNKWQPVIKLSIALGLSVLVVYYASSYMGKRVTVQSKEKKKVALTGRVDFLRRKNTAPSKYEELLKEAEKIQFSRDPFVLDVEVVEEIPQEGPLVLQGIMRAESSHPRVMINGEVLEIGSFVDHFMVVDIKKDHVILIDNDPTVPEADRTIILQLTN